MKILHCMLSCFYVDGYNYQENVLPRQNKLDGHEVKIIASTESFSTDNKIKYLKPSIYYNEDGIEVNRIKYKKHTPKALKNKLRIYQQFDFLIESFAPDIILFHGFGGAGLLTVVKYVKKHPNVRLFVDSHEDFHNSGTNWLSRVVLHQGYNRYIVQKALPYIEKILCVGYECYEFLNKMYKVPEDMMELYPLGGTVFPEKIRQEKRMRRRMELGLKDNDILLVHSGKMDKYKRTVDILKAFKQVNSNNIQIVIIGALTADVKERVMQLIQNDDRVKFLGWKNSDDLLEFLCASDLYIQPGGQSATMQNAACCGSGLALYPYPSHKVLMENSVFYIETVQDIQNLFIKIIRNPDYLEIKRKTSYNLAKEKLDYKELAKRIYV